MMGGRTRILPQALSAWLRQVLPPAWAVVLFGVVLVLFEALAHTLFGYAERASDWNDLLQRFHVPRDMCLIIGLVSYAFYRAIAKHPFYRPAYAQWLSRTPWTPRLPLPLGPVRLVPQDAVVFLLFWLVTLENSSLGFHTLAGCLLVPYLLVLLLPLRLAGATAHCYLIAYGIMLAVWLGLPSPTATLVLGALYLVAWHGLPISLGDIGGEASPQVAEFVQKNFVKQSVRTIRLASLLGYPFAQLNPQGQFESISLREALLLSWLAAAGLFAFSSQSASIDRDLFGLAFATAGICGTACVRLMRYYGQYHPPISLLGRVATGQWIIRNYDSAALPSLAALCVAALPMLAMRYFPGWNVGPLALGVGLTIVLGMPPTLRDWALTGNHRIVAQSTRKAEFVEL